jgi:hypothetical protein
MCGDRSPRACPIATPSFLAAPSLLGVAVVEQGRLKFLSWATVRISINP